MKQKLIVTIILALMMLATSMIVSCVGKTEAPEQLIEDVTAEQAFRLIEENKNDPDLLIIDVRTPQEYTDGHIEDAINMDFNSGAFGDEVRKLDRTKKYLVYCRSGNRSRGAINEMTQLGFEQVYHLYVGIVGWSDAGYPLVK